MAEGARAVSVNTWLKLLLAGAYTFLLRGIILGLYVNLMVHTELPQGTSIPDT